MNKKILKFFSINLLIIMFLLSGCSSKVVETKNKATITIKDMIGREVSLNSSVKKVVAIGPGALRLYFYVGSSDKIAGIENMEKSNSNGKPYILANESIKSLPTIGQGGPNNAPDAEKILAVKPDVIFTTYIIDKSLVDELQNKTGIPVVALSYGKVATFDPNLYNSIKLIGKVINKEKRANEVVNYMENCKKDLDTRTKDILQEEKCTTYVGGLGMKGTHGIESTQGNYSLFNVVHAKNVADETGKTGSVMIDKEKLLQWNPDKIFIDLGGLNIIKEDYRKNTQFYNSISAFKNGQVYSQLPYNYYSTNIDTAIADAYYIGKVLYPEKFKDIEPEKKADEIYKFLLGKQLYSEMCKTFGGFKKITLG
ncbi:iron complex transport system substrate-binding protein [Clostridium tetanomorphum]|uniref:Iron ABC transporter substrate-binding protein n=1 Tax=Clostridium tetanomorphum TaxID=1553 RepID=A0A923E9T9_CLOTT|nr:iron ABC transporter substrate-binding protein [Clostridium tetanomorphum]KAJ51706.1 metal ion (Fe 3+) ABC transporter ATPase [Clostridium tetanomorphum DSM 665]MBC2399118.1 iron ABC transporter substrate-binding protein [Clostridium tetanomorphum]MBP1865928.1 iron complex transport system substrate-binding protein [Clostridium tetanomorphum]NRS86109.1 iron complex transport system substrate-binding protein [Clostridium tetanomorphum]NRZ95870.1 iron complex transport system substrate-bindin